MTRIVLLLVVCLSPLALAQETLTPPPLLPTGEVEAQPPPLPEPSAQAPSAYPQPLNRKRDTGRYKYDANLGVPQGYFLVTEPRWLLVAGGVAIFAGGTAISGLFALAMSEPVHVIPLVGPIVSTVNAWSWAGSNTSRGAAAFFYTWLTITEFVLQAAGITCFVLGFALPAHWLEKVRPPRVSVTPVVSSTFTGLALAGSF